MSNLANVVHDITQVEEPLKVTDELHLLPLEFGAYSPIL